MVNFNPGLLLKMGDEQVIICCTKYLYYLSARGAASWCRFCMVKLFYFFNRGKIIDLIERNHTRDGILFILRAFSAGSVIAGRLVIFHFVDVIVFQLVM
jgi:hypothetical protein